MDVGSIDSLNYQAPLVDLVADKIDAEAIAESGVKLRLSTVTRDGGHLRYVTEKGDIETEDGRLVREGRVSAAAVNRGDTLRAPTVADGVLASSAIPLYFKAWLMEGGEYYWDGAVRESVPVKKAMELGATDLVVVLTGDGPWAHESPTRPRGHALVIERVHQVDNPEGVIGRVGDFYPSISLGGRGWISRHHRDDDREFSPRWTFPVIPGGIEIRILDHEGSPDLCDVNPDPQPGRKTLRVNLSGEQITGDVEGRVGDLFHARGEGDDDRVEIWFRIVAHQEGSQTYTGGLDIMGLAPIRNALDLLGHMHQEVDVQDLDILTTLDVLHEVARDVGEGTVLPAVRSIPLPRDIAGRAYRLPRYVVIEAPIGFGDALSFDPTMINLNIELGELTARYTRVDFLDAREAARGPDGYVHPTQDPSLTVFDLEAQKKQAILAWLDQKIAMYREREGATFEMRDEWDVDRRKGMLQLQQSRRTAARGTRELLEKARERYEAARIVLTRRNPAPWQ